MSPNLAAVYSFPRFILFCGAKVVYAMLRTFMRKMISDDAEVDSSLEYLKQILMKSSGGTLIMNERDKIESLVEKIEYMKGFLKVMEKKRYEHPEVMKLVMQIKSVVCVAKRIVSKFVSNVLIGAFCPPLREHEDNLSLNLESVEKEINSLTAEVKHFYDENMYDINGVAVKKLEHSSIGSEVKHIYDENMCDINGVAFKKLEHSSTGSGGIAGLGSSGVRHIPKSGEEKVVVGFEKEVKTLIGHLANTEERLKIISIIGTAGGGKTTLAREVYHHPFTSHIFQIRAWVTVSQSYDKNMKRNLLIRLLESKREDTKEESDTLEIHEDYEMSSENSLGEKVLKCLKGKSLKGRKYLIVMDDIWGVEAWNDIQNSFPKECKGSKVLFTSRFVVQPDGVNFIRHDLTPLPKDLSWKLLEKKVFGTKDCPRELVDIGEQIAGKCEGLPLAIVAIAGILAMKDKTLDVWKEVAKNLSSIIANKNQDSCMDILELSYNHLPPHLKDCFLYMGGFPEDLEIPTRKLLWLWAKKGFIHQTEAEKSLEDVGKDCLIGLIDRNLVMVAKKSSNGRIKACRIHDLLRVLCLKKAEDDKLLEQIYKEGDFFSPFDANMLRGLSYGLFQGVILYLYWTTNEDSMIGRFIRKTLLPILTKLRKPLAINLPPEIFHMVELRHLYSKEGVFNYHFRKKLAPSSNLDNLRTLHRICSCKDCQSFLVKTPNLRKLGFFGELKSQDGVLMIPDLEFLKSLEKLSITYLRYMGEPVPSRRTLPAALKFPSTITQITLKDTRLKWEELSILQTLPNLEVLKLLRDACGGPVWNTNELEGSFELKYLKYLRFDSLEIEEWNASEEQFPKLEVLVLRYCKKLKGIPIDFANLSELSKIELHYCSYSVKESAMEIREEQKYTKGDEDECLNLTVL